MNSCIIKFISPALSDIEIFACSPHHSQSSLFSIKKLFYFHLKIKTKSFRQKLLRKYPLNWSDLTKLHFISVPFFLSFLKSEFNILENHSKHGNTTKAQKICGTNSSLLRSIIKFRFFFLDCNSFFFVNILSNFFLQNYFVIKTFRCWDNWKKIFLHHFIVRLHQLEFLWSD